MRRHTDDTDDPFADPADLDDPFAEDPAAPADVPDADEPEDTAALDLTDPADADAATDDLGRSELEHDLVDPDLVDVATQDADDPTDEPLSILVVCTANICRSPMAEAMLQHALDQVGVDARVSSAGFLARNQPAHRHAAAVMRDRGLDVSKHRSRRLTQGLVAQQDLIVTMTREHVRDVISAWPDATARCYTLASLAEVDTAPVSLDPDDVDAWTRARHERRPASAVLGRGDDDIRDPMGKSRRTFARVADEIGAYCDVIAELLAAVPASRADTDADDAAFSAA